MITTNVISELKMANPESFESSIANLESFRAEREASSSFNPQIALPERQETVTRRIVPVRIAGMIGRMVVTEPTEGEAHLDRPAIIIAHGFMASRPAYNGYAKELASYGYRVAHGGVPRTSKPWKHYHPTNLRDAIRSHSQILNGFSREMVRQYPESPERHHMVGHSLGGYALSKLLEYRPEATESAVLLASAGLQPHSFLQMAGRAREALTAEIVPFIKHTNTHEKIELAQHSAWHLLRNVPMTIREGYHASTGDALRGVRTARSKGVGVGALWLTHDSFFPLSEIDTQLKAEFDAWRIALGNHLAPQEDMRYIARETLHLFNEMQSKQGHATNVISIV